MALINDPDPRSDIFMSEEDRFNRDFSQVDYQRRSNEYERKKLKNENFKNHLFEREKKRWEKMDYDYLRNENKIIINKEKNMVGRKNHAG